MSKKSKRFELKDHNAVSSWLNRISVKPPDLADVIIQNVDLRPFDQLLAQLKSSGCILLGCDIGPLFADKISKSYCATDCQQQCLIFPKIHGHLPFNPYRTKLYQPIELLGDFNCLSIEEDLKIYEASTDWQSYCSILLPNSQPKDHKINKHATIDEILFRRLHDTSIADALDEFIRDHIDERKVNHGIVAIMGGHGISRTEPLYLQIAELAFDLAKAGYIVASGGGPGVMEATNLGAYFANRSKAEIPQAIHILSSFPKFVHGRSAEWIQAAMRVRKQFPVSQDCMYQSLGVPTWIYGHEPPNPFATHIAKYFENSVREEGLLAIADCGVVFAPGNAGTVQEIFQDACQNYYGTYNHHAPMILFGNEYWNSSNDSHKDKHDKHDKRKQVYPLLKKMMEEKDLGESVSVTDSPGEVIQTISKYTKSRVK